MIPPKRPTQYDLLKQPDEDFEAMVARLVRLEYSDAFKPANTSDGGADMVLQGPKERSGHERCWQAKHYPQRIGWTKCKESLAAAQKHWQPRYYTFVFPRDLTVTEQNTFERHFGDSAITVDYWNGDRLQGLLTESDEGQRVAKTFFDDVELDKENLTRAIEVGGKLATPEDALDRLGNVGGFLASSDAYFWYPSSTQEPDGPGQPVPPGSVMSFSSAEGPVTSRIDVVPRDGEAMERYGPELRVQATDDEVGRAAGKRLQQALQEGKEVEIGEGLEVIPTRMPPQFKDVVGQTMTGTVRVGPAERARRKAQPWRPRLMAKANDEEASVSVLLAPTPGVPEGWDDCFSGEFAGMTVTALFREFATGGGEVRWNFRHRRDGSPVRDQLRALQFMRVLSLGGEIAVEAAGRPLSKSVVPAEPLPRDAQALIAFFEDVRTIEEWTGVEFSLPESIEPVESRNVADLAAWIRHGGSNVTWEAFGAVVTDVQPLRDQRLLRVERKVGAKALGRIVDLGVTRLDLVDYEVVDHGEATDGSGGFDVRIKPTAESEGRAFEALALDKTRPRQPPPRPPKKKRVSKGHRRRKKRSR